jgi:hypothetical protein
LWVRVPTPERAICARSRLLPRVHPQERYRALDAAIGGDVLPTELRSHGYEEGRGRGADGQPFVSAGGIERLGIPGRVHTDLCVACRPFDLRLDVSNQPGSNPAALEAGADAPVPEVAARPTSRAYERPVALSDEQPSVGGHALKPSLLDLPEQLRDLELRVGRRSVAGNGCLTDRGHLVEVTRTCRTDSHLHDIVAPGSPRPRRETSEGRIASQCMFIAPQPPIATKKARNIMMIEFI